MDDQTLMIGDKEIINDIGKKLTESKTEFYFKFKEHTRKEFCYRSYSLLHRNGRNII